MQVPVLRQVHKKNFTTIPNELLQDQRLSCRDRGLLVWMLSKSQEWKFSQMGIAAELSLDGEASIKAGVKSLQEAGYLTIERNRQAQGKLSSTVWTVYDQPQGENQLMGSPQVDFPQVGNRPYIKERNIKRKPAAPALEGGQQQEIYRDAETGEWKRR